MIIIPRQDDNYRDIIDWLTAHVAPSSRQGYEPHWGSQHSKKVEWQAQNHTWRILLDDRAREISISVMDAEKENALREFLKEKS